MVDLKEMNIYSCMLLLREVLLYQIRVMPLLRIRVQRFVSKSMYEPLKFTKYYP